MNTNTPILTWQAATRRDTERSRNWYFMAGALAVSAIVYALLTESYPLALTVIAIVAVFVLFDRLPYHRFQVSVSPEGFQLDDVVKPWSDCANFWILMQEGYAELHIGAKKGRDIRILIEGVNPYDVRDAMLAFLPQDSEKREKILDYIIRFCKL